MAKISILRFPILLLILSSCSKDTLPEFNKLEGLRILAFQTSTPEVSPGATVTLTPIVSDIHGATLKYSASTCIDFGISYGVPATCNGNPTKIVIATNLALTSPGISESWTGLADSFSVVIPADTIIFADRSSQEIFNGVNYLIEYILENDQGQKVTSIKRILVSEAAKTAKNSNPLITDVLANGTSLAAMNWGAKSQLTTDLSLASAETYTIKNSNLELVTETEKLTTTWFVTDGETKFYRSAGVDANEFTAPDQAPVGRSVYLLAITRDDRGGLGIVKKKF